MTNKTIIAEYPIELSNDNNNFILYRFPDLKKELKINRIKHSEKYEYTEIEMNFPKMNVSECKLKVIKSPFITYRSEKVMGMNYYLVCIINGKAILHKVSQLNIFEAYHHYYTIDLESKYNNEILKQKNDEGIEYSKTNDLKNIKKTINEEMKVLKYEDYSEKYKNVFEPINCELNNENIIIVNEIKKDKKRWSNSKIEKTIKNARIVNFNYLVKISGCEDIVKSILIKMTTKLNGRFILKNKFYEKSLENKRTQLLELFKEREEIKIDSTLFLKDDQWIVDEIANRIGTNYILKGFYEKVEFNTDEIKSQNQKKINDILEKYNILGAKEISLYTAIEEDLINMNFQEKQDEYHYLANNGFVLINDNKLINSIFKELTTKKNISMEEIKNICDVTNSEYDECFIISELKKYCNLRSKKFFLKNLNK